MDRDRVNRLADKGILRQAIHDRVQDRIEGVLEEPVDGLLPTWPPAFIEELVEQITDGVMRVLEERGLV